MTCSKSTSKCTGLDVRAVRFVGDVTRTRHQLCAACRSILVAPPFSIVLAAADEPEWVLRGRERRLPVKVDQR